MSETIAPWISIAAIIMSSAGLWLNWLTYHEKPVLVLFIFSCVACLASIGYAIFGWG